jgi:hypothetical protein
VTITLERTDADKYETKREGLTLDEALEAAVWGYRVRSPSIAPNAYIHYEFNGWRIQFVHDGREGSSSGWTPDRAHQIALWSIVPDKDETPARDAWGKPVQQWPVATKRDSWGRPI